VHESPDDIPVGKSDIDPALRAKLDAFRGRVSENRLVKFWKNAAELPGLVALSLSKTVKLYPAVGWVRASNVASDELLIDINAVRKENEQLRRAVAELESRAAPEETYDLASLDDTFEVTIEYTVSHQYGSYEETKKVEVTWAEMFACIAPDLLEHPSDGSVNFKLGAALYRKLYPGRNKTVKVQHDDFQTVKTQFTALDLIAISYSKTTKGGMGLFWSMTKLGQALMKQLRTVKSASNKTSGDDVQ